MSCSAYQELLSAQVDGELSPRERRRLADHVAGCEPCREQHDSLVALKREIASSISGTDEIDRRQLRQVMARHGRRAQRVRIAAAAIAAGVVLCCAAWLLTSSRARAPRFRASSHPLGFVPPPRMPDHPVAEASSRPILVSAAGQLVRVAPGRPGLEQLTLPPAGASDMRPVVSPDGRHVLFERRSADRRQLWVLDLTTGTTRPAVRWI